MKKVLRAVLVLFIGCMVGGTAVEAASSGLFSYEGWGIASKRSIHSADLSKTSSVYIKHTQKNGKWKRGNQLTVKVQKMNDYGWATVGSKIFSGNTSGSYSLSCSKGKYSLYFLCVADCKYDIKGYFEFK